jgi:hypothetical protein
VKKSDRLGRVDEDASPCSRRTPASDQREVLGVDVLASKRLKSDLTSAWDYDSSDSPQLTDQVQLLGSSPWTRTM